MNGVSRLFVISGPSGVGKGTLVAQARNKRPDIVFAVSVTTREPRPGEIDGREYRFFSREKFKELLDRDAFLEWAEVYGNFYGTLKSEAEEPMQNGNSVILEIDTQGALQVKEKFPDARLIFIAPPNLDELAKRLKERKTETEEQVARRLDEAAKEIALIDEYDEVIVNDDISLASQALVDIFYKHEQQ